MLPRPVVPGARYLVTRRCTRREFWLRPCQLTNQIVRYCVAVAAERSGVQVHGICVLSNHWHAVLTDPEGQLPRFTQWVHEYIAKCVNVSYGRWENLWSSEQTSAVRLVDDGDVLDKLAYCLANPVSAGLVARGEQWPGVRTSAADVAGARYEVQRPEVFFRPDGPTPESATLRIVRPDICPGLSDAELADAVSVLVESREAESRQKLKQAGRRFMGASAVKRQRPSERPRTAAPRRGLSPRVAAKNKWRRIEALGQLKKFVAAHKQAMSQWAMGARDVVFPPGTYKMRVLHQVRCAGADTS